MTAPVQEPTQGRIDQAQEFRTRQLFRRPAPAASAGVEMWPSSYNLMRYGDWLAGVDYPDQTGHSGSYWEAVADNTRVGGFYIRNFLSGAYLQYAAFVRYVRLGPQGSAWGITAVTRTANNNGKFSFALQYVGDDSPDDSFIADGRGTFPDSYLGDSPFTSIPGAFFGNGVAPTIDTYAGGGVLERVWTGYSQFRLMGDPGTPITSVTAIHSGDPYPEFDGGPGWYALLVYVNGKNASSSDYRIEISQLMLQRFSYGGFVA